MTAHRRAWRMRLRPGAEAAYDAAHAAVWPELLAEMHANGIAIFRIFRDGGDIFAYQERTAPFPAPGAEPSETMRRWWREMEPLMVTDMDGRPVQRMLTEVFDLDAAGPAE